MLAYIEVLLPLFRDTDWFSCCFISWATVIAYFDSCVYREVKRKCI